MRELSQKTALVPWIGDIFRLVEGARGTGPRDTGQVASLLGSGLEIRAVPANVGRGPVPRHLCPNQGVYPIRLNRLAFVGKTEPVWIKTKLP